MPREVNIYVNSNIDRLINENNSASEKFTVALPGNKEIQIFPEEKTAKIKVNQVEIPNVLYNFPPTQNSIWFVVYDGNGDPDSLEELMMNPDRVYNTPADVVNELNSLVAGNAVLNSGSGVVFSYSDLTKKITITNNSSNTIRPVSSYRFNDGADGLGVAFSDAMDRLGLSLDYRNVRLNNGEALIGNGYIRMLYSQCFYLALEELSGYYNQNIIPSPDTNKRICARVSVANYGSLSQYSFVSEVDMNLPGEMKINRLTFSLLDDEFRPVDLKNHYITFSARILIE